MDGVSQQGMQWECGRGWAGRDQVPGKDRWGVVGVAAAPHQGGFIPGNLQAGSCFITCEGKAVMKPEFYTLNPGGTDLVWAAAAEGKVPLGAVQGGVSEAGEDLYIGRCKLEGKKVYGKVQPSQQGCLVPHAGEEVSSSSYEVLCARTVLTNFKSFINTGRRVSSPGSGIVTRLSSLSPISPVSPISPTKRRPLRGSGDSWRRLTTSSSNILQLSGCLKSAVTRTTNTVKSQKISGPFTPLSRSPTNTRTPTSRTTSPSDLTFVTPKSRVVSPRTPTSRSPVARTPTSRSPAARTPTSRSPVARTPTSRSPTARTPPKPRILKRVSPVEEFSPGGWVRRRGRGVCRLRRC
ncbi:putative protein TPRXL [Penaeus japonicus]|uniref:putative protein TPRXL n=1 Tax=Penaeus japonicus TaxID=27405 RepID=UPI001C71218F|nr:putative protein TPRXL [Penaeus japonicus]